MKKVKLYIYNYLFIVLCCAYCLYKNLHPNHKILEISDVDSIKKENISLENSTEDLTNIVEKIKLLKDKIEKEINNINILYEKAIEDLTKDFKEKIENLKKAEKEIKEKLENEVTKVKEKLENILSEIYNLVNMIEKINKGIKNLIKKKKI